MFSNIAYEPCMKKIAAYQDPSESWFSHEITARYANVVALPLGILCSIADGVVGVAATAYSLVPTLALSRDTNTLARENMMSLGQIAGRTFVNTFSIINPRVGANIYVADRNIKTKPYGIFSNVISKKLKNYFSDCTEPRRGIITKHVVSRIGFVATAGMFAITRTVDLVVGVAAGVFAVLALGSNKTLNSFAFQGLNFPCVINDVIDCARKVLNPFYY